MMTTAATSDEICEVPIVHAAAVRRARERRLAPETIGQIADLFATLGDPTRVKLVAALAGGEMCVCDLAAAIGLSQSAVSHQLRLLRERGLARARRAGRVVYYALDDEHVLALFRQGLDHVAHGQVAAADARRAGR